MNILITGATGLVGKALIQKLLLNGHNITAVSRVYKTAKKSLPSNVKVIECDLNYQTIPAKQIEDIDSVVSLMGENVSYGRWSKKRKQRIHHSRVEANKNLLASIKDLKINCFVGASAIGVYKQSQGDEVLDENSETDSHFLANVCKDWEGVYQELDQSVRSVILRIGVVLDQSEGMLKKLIPIYRLGLGGPIGNGKGWMSWIHVDDLVSMIHQSLKEDSTAGVYNAVTPNACQNKDLNFQLAKAVHRPAIFNVPHFMIKLLFGEMGSLALNSQRITTRFPMKFKYSTIKEAIDHVCINKTLPPHKKTSFHYRFQVNQFIASELDEVFDFFKEAKNLENITPPLLNFRILNQSTPEIKQGTEFNYKLKVHGIPIYWKTIITNWKTNEMFTDYQAKGPYKTWFHTHEFHKVNGGVLMVDTVDYALPFGYLGDLFGKWLVKKDVQKIFDYRKEVIEEVFKHE